MRGKSPGANGETTSARRPARPIKGSVFTPTSFPPGRTRSPFPAVEGESTARVYGSYWVYKTQLLAPQFGPTLRFCDFVLHRRYAGLSLMRGPATPIRTGSRPSHTIATFSEVPYTPRMTSSTWLFSITHWLHQLDARIVSGMRQGCHLNVKLLFATPHSMRAHQYCARRGKTVSPRCRLVPSPRKSGASDGRVKSKASWVDCFFNRFVGRRRQKA